MSLAGKSLLVVEDSLLVALDIQTTLNEAGGTVVGPSSSVASSERLLEVHHIDGAILDVNLKTEVVYPLARKLMDRSVPFTFLTGYNDDVLPPEFAEIPRLLKPVRKEELLAQVIGLFDGNQ